MECNNCREQNAYRLKFYEDGSMCCNSCGGLRSATFSDVFFKQPYLDPHLIDTAKPHERNGVWINSREQKAQLLRARNAHEAGDREHGARI